MACCSGQFGAGAIGGAFGLPWLRTRLGPDRFGRRWNARYCDCAGAVWFGPDDARGAGGECAGGRFLDRRPLRAEYLGPGRPAGMGASERSGDVRHHHVRSDNLGQPPPRPPPVERFARDGRHRDTRRFVLGWKMFRLERTLGARLVTYADDVVILCRRGKAKRPKRSRGLGFAGAASALPLLHRITTSSAKVTSRAPRVRSSLNIFHPSTNRRMSLCLPSRAKRSTGGGRGGGCPRLSLRT